MDVGIVIQQTLNALTIGAMYALIALGYTMVYGIIELINFAHGDVFMVGSFVTLWLLTTFGVQGTINNPVQLVFLLIVMFAFAMIVMGLVGRSDRALRLPATPQCAPPGAADHGHRRELHSPERDPGDLQQRRLQHPAGHRPAGAESLSPCRASIVAGVAVTSSAVNATVRPPLHHRPGHRHDRRPAAVRSPNQARPGHAIHGDRP